MHSAHPTFLRPAMSGNRHLRTPPPLTRELLAPRLLRVRSHAGRQHARIGLSRVWPAVPRPLRLTVADARRHPSALGHVALSRRCCRSRDGESPSRSAKGRTPMHDLPALAREIGVGTPVGEGRRAQSHGIVQGARHVRRRHARRGARRPGSRRTDGGQCRRGARRHTPPPRGIPVRVYAPRTHAVADPRHHPRARRRPATRGRPHRRRRQAVARASRRSTATSTSPRCASRIASRARRRWVSSSPSSSAGGCRRTSSIPPVAARA